MKRLQQLVKQFKEPANGEVLLEEDQKYMKEEVGPYQFASDSDLQRFKRDEAEERLLELLQ